MTNNARKIKFSPSALDIIGMIFTPLGAIFIIIGVSVTGFANANPDKVTGDPGIFLPIFGGIGGSFFLLGAVFLSITVYKHYMQAQLLQEGHCITAQITSFNPNYNVRVNGRCPFVAECSYTDPATGAVHLFRSRNVYFDPSMIVTGSDVPVYVKPDDFRHYYVDIDAVLPQVVKH